MWGQNFRVFLGSTSLAVATLALAGCPQPSETNNTTDEAAAVTQDTSSALTTDGSTQESGGTSTSVSEGQLVEPTDVAPIDTPLAIVGDYDGDQKVSESDIRLLSRSFGSTLNGGDLNSDGRIDILDLAILLTMVP